jgi:predicted nuclease of predicted toxin-antitoxin system
MKFLIDAQLPRRLVYRLQEAGHGAIHTLDLPLGNRSSDQIINEISEREQRIVITKDADFVNSFTLYGKPYKLLLN